MVVTVRVADTGLPLGVTEAGEKEQLAPLGAGSIRQSNKQENKGEIAEGAR